MSVKQVIEQSQQIIQDWLNGIGLEPKPSKTQISHTLIPYQNKVGFDFLGFSTHQFSVGKHISGRRTNGKPLGFKTIISPSKAKLKQHASDIGNIIHQLRGISQIGLISRLKPVIIGWCNYFRSSCCSKSFAELDYILFQQLKAWSKRRHPNKSKRWLRHRYWRRTASNQIRFAARFNGIEIVLPLTRIGSTGVAVSVVSLAFPEQKLFCSNDKRANALSATSSSNMETYWKLTITALALRAETSRSTTSRFSIDIATT